MRTTFSEIHLLNNNHLRARYISILNRKAWRVENSVETERERERERERDGVLL
jgi:hypothetical protein